MQGSRPSQHRDARARGPAGDAHGHSAGLSRLRAAQDGHGDARRRGSEDQQARRQLRDAARSHRRSGARCRALLPRVAQGGHASSCSTSTSRARSPRTIRCTTCSTRTRACARCCARPASRCPRRRFALGEADVSRADEPLRRSAAAPARRFSGRARQRGARPRAAPGHVLPQGFGPGIPQLL